MYRRPMTSPSNSSAGPRRSTSRLRPLDVKPAPEHRQHPRAHAGSCGASLHIDPRILPRSHDNAAVSAGFNRKVRARPWTAPRGDLAGVQFWVNSLNTSALTREQVRRQFAQALIELGDFDFAREVLDGIEDLWRSRLERIDDLLQSERTTDARTPNRGDRP